MRAAPVLLIWVFTVALAAQGLAHRMPVPSPWANAPAFFAPGDLCGDTDPQQPAHADCSLCHVVAGLIPPSAPIGLRDADLIHVAGVVAPRERRSAHRPLDPANPPHGPPSLV